MQRLSICVVFCLLIQSALADPGVRLEQDGKNVKVYADGSFFAEYLTDAGRQPVIWPIVGPTGAAYTRSYPVGPRGPLEADDHLHHESLWFAHGDVNGSDYWSNGHGEQECEIRHREFVRLECDGATATVVTRNDWVSSGVKQCEDLRTIVFGVDESARWIDFSIRLQATEGELKLGDTKEGTFAVRVAGSMKVDSPGKGRIVNSREQKDKDAWGQPAEWVDYHGPLEGEDVGIAILSHPESFRHPCKWHVREYGLFAANPFGEADFPKSEVTQGEVVLQPGEHLDLRYLVVLHRGDEKSGKIASKFRAWADER